MNDAQLREELGNFGVNVGPINDSTRETYTRLLAKKKGGSPSRSSSRKSYSPARPTAAAVTPKTPPVTRRNVSPPVAVERVVPISPPRRAPLAANRRPSPPTNRRPSPPSNRRVSPPSPRRDSPPPLTRQQPPSSSSGSPRPIRHVSPTKVSPPAARQQQQPIQSYRVSPRPFKQASSQYSSRTADSITTPDYPLNRSTAAYNRIDFDNSVPDDDDDHMEFSKYIPRSGGNQSKRHQNTSLTSSFLNNTKKKIASVHPPKGFELNPIFLTGVAFAVVFIGYILYPDKINDGISSTSNYFNSAIMTGFRYAVLPILILGAVFGIGCAFYYLFQTHTRNKAIYEEKKRKMIKDILKAVYNAPTNGIPVKQLRDRMIPAYNRSKDELLLWNECEDFVKTYETRVRAEERANHNGDEIVEHFVWVASTLNQDLEDD